MHFHFSKREKFDLLKGWLAISIAFAIVMTGPGLHLAWVKRFLFAALTSLFTVGLGFILHELAHKWQANRMNCHAEFKSNDSMLIFALVTSLLGFIIAAPGAVHISGHPDIEKRGRIAMMGPATNLVLALLFLALYFLLPGFWSIAAGFGSIINTWLGLFNLIPFAQFDGAKVFVWNKAVYGGIVAVGVLLSFIQVPLGLL